MAWPKGKPRLTDEERAAKAARAERPMYPAWWEYVGCGYCPYKITGPFVSGRDDDAFNSARALAQSHVTEVHGGAPRRKKDALATAVDAAEQKSDAALRDRLQKGSI